jgi:hypothetical protein
MAIYELPPDWRSRKGEVHSLTVSVPPYRNEPGYFTDDEDGKGDARDDGRQVRGLRV